MGFDDGVIDSAGRAYLKKKAIDTCINFVGRTISQSEFRLKEEREILKTEDWSYKLNVRPNTDQSAADFWQKVIYKLLYDNEVLIVLSDSSDLLIADSFVRTEYALYDDRFDSVVVKDYMFDRSFFMDEVIYLNYNNEPLENYIAGLFGDYGELFGRMIDSSMRNNQIRGTVEVSSMQGTTEEKNKTLQDYVDRIFKGFKKAVAIVPITKGLEYKEVSGGTNKNSGQSFEEIDKLQKSALNEVAKLIGVPPSLVQGEMANQDSAQETYINFCINPLLKKLEDELNAKVLSKRQFKRGKYFEVVNTNRPKPVKDIVEDSSNIDKLLASGVVNRNFVRSLYGLEPVNGGDEYYVTKNYEQEMKGGDAENEEAEN
ncbi:MAG: phage portal protein [Leuconostoc sp.]|nr:phage portal protein [Leuconostoc sp.]